MTHLNDALANHGLECDTPHFPTDFLALVTRKPINTVRQWNQRIGDADIHYRAATRRGVSALYSYRSLATYCAATPMINSGIDILRAFNAAKVWTIEEDRQTSERHRQPMGLYENDLTILVYRPERPFTLPYSQLKDRPFDFLFPATEKSIAPVLVLLDQVRSELNHAIVNFLDPLDI